MHRTVTAHPHLILSVYYFIPSTPLLSLPSTCPLIFSPSVHQFIHLSTYVLIHQIIQLLMWFTHPSTVLFIDKTIHPTISSSSSTHPSIILSLHSSNFHHSSLIHLLFSFITPFYISSYTCPSIIMSPMNGSFSPFICYWASSISHQIV